MRRGSSRNARGSGSASGARCGTANCWPRIAADEERIAPVAAPGFVRRGWPRPQPLGVRTRRIGRRLRIAPVAIGAPPARSELIGIAPAAARAPCATMVAMPIPGAVPNPLRFSRSTWSADRRRERSEAFARSATCLPAEAVAELRPRPRRQERPREQSASRPRRSAATRSAPRTAHRALRATRHAPRAAVFYRVPNSRSPASPSPGRM